MNIWILVSAIGLIFIIIGFISFIGKYQIQKPLKNSTFLLGIFIPILGASTYSETLLELIPELTLIDLGAFIIMGMISGFFVALFLLQRKSIATNQV
jgi:tellurite resistance protein TehA-like permease